MTDFWRFFCAEIGELLGEDDDTAFWQGAVDRILADTHATAEAYAGKDFILVEVGRCSHWIRPIPNAPPEWHGHMATATSAKAFL